MEDKKCTKVCIVSGFLGAGKTTFIQELIKKVFTDEKVVLIENEFGEVSVDSGFMQKTGIEVTEMNSGCICCSLVGDFTLALQEAIETLRPDRILIEPSGVGKLSDVAAAVMQVNEKIPVAIDSKITVVDGKKAVMYIKNFGEFFNNQVENASTIVMSRTQMIDDKKRQECLNLLREHNGCAEIITTPWAELTPEMLKQALFVKRDFKHELMEEHEHCHHGHGHDHEHHSHDCDCGCHDHDHEHHSHDCDCGGHDHDHEHDHEHHSHDCDCGGHDHEHEHHHDHDCDCGCHDHDHHHHHDHHADEVFASWGTETAKQYDREEIRRILGQLDGSDADEKNCSTSHKSIVLRAKGILQDKQGKWFEFDMVPSELEFRDRTPDYIGRICVIGTKLDEEELQKLFG